MKNIEVFDRCVAKIFADLYESFPIPTTVMFFDVSLEIFASDDDDPSEMDLKRDILEHTVSWLAMAKYIVVERVTPSAAVKAVLTPKGLELLKMPSSLNVPGESVGESIANAVKSGAIETAVDLAKSVIASGVTLVLSGT